MKPAARVGDLHVCPMFNGPVPHVGGPILPPGCPTVLIGGMPAARVTDKATCVGPPDSIVTGSPTVHIGNLMAARMGDSTAHGGTIVMGCFTVLIGDAAAGGGPGGFTITSLPNGDIQLGNGIIFHGTPAFQAQVIDRLALIASTITGMQTLNGINTSGRTMIIIEFTGPNSFCGPTNYSDASAAGRPVFDGNGNPINSSAGTQQIGTGRGSDTTLEFNPNLALPNSSDPAHSMPNDTVLFHEMTHGSHMMNGTYDGSPVPGWDTAEEQITISTGTPSEAGYLNERGYPWQRTSHGLTWAPNP